MNEQGEQYMLRWAWSSYVFYLASNLEKECYKMPMFQTEWNNHILNQMVLLPTHLSPFQNVVGEIVQINLVGS